MGPDTIWVKRRTERTRRTAGWLVATAVLASSLVTLSPSLASATGPNTTSILSSVNSSRANAGRRPLSLRSDLSAVAYRWSQRMAASGTLKHNPSLSSQVTGWRWVGENVGFGPDWRAVQVALMNSPSHRANILDSDFSQIGIGVVVRNGRVWITQVFRSPSGSSAAPMPKQKKPATSPRRRPAAQPKPRPPARHAAPLAKPVRRPGPKPAPSPAELLERRIDSAKAKHTDRPSADPLLAALLFADAMHTVGG